jgi:uncharacterized protein
MSPLNILRESPHDGFVEDPVLPPVAAQGTGESRWTPSRYNVRATTDDGQLVLWNTFSGSMSIFTPD